jgi:recombination protein RecA
MREELERESSNDTGFGFTNIRQKEPAGRYRARGRESGALSPPAARSPRLTLVARFPWGANIRSVRPYRFHTTSKTSEEQHMAMADKEQEKAAKARDAALNGALSQIERQFGKGSIMKMGDEDAKVRVDAIPTGALSLDIALGVGGMPRGRIVEVFGPESSGKTTLLYHLLAEAQKKGGICAFIDAEHAMDPAYAKRIGLDVDELLVSQPDHGEQALEIADMLIRSGAIDVVAIDSVAALTPKVELEGAMGDQTVGLQARMMSQAMRKLAGNLNRADTLCIFTNQIREKVGVMFGSPETQPGGRALKFYASQRLDIRRIETLKDGVEAVGNRVRVKVVKNKVAAPFRQAEFDIEYGHGISSEGCILDLGLEHDIVQKSGSFFSYGDERLGQGRNNAKAYLRENPALARTIEEKVYVAVGMAPRDGTPLPAPTEVAGAPEAVAEAETEADAPEPVVQAA